MKPISHNQLMTCVFFLAVIIVGCTNKVCLTVQAKEVTTMALIDGAKIPLILMFLYGFMWIAENKTK